MPCRLRRALVAATAVVCLADLPAQQIPWQRSFTDALELSRSSRRPLLFCVNTDGEVFCDRLARTTYRDPEFVAAMAKYVPVICSPDRHTPYDHDAQGRRIPCPRFGSVTCGEHIRIEPPAFDRFFKGNRVAPRHLAVDADGKELFDRFLDRSLDIVEEAVREHAPPDPAPLTRGGGPAELFASRAAGDRTALEELYAESDAAGRADLLRAAAAASNEPYDVIRLGLREADAPLRALAEAALAATLRADGVELALAAMDNAGDARPLQSALELVAQTDITARRGLTARRSLAETSTTVDVAAWQRALGSRAAATEQVVSDDEVSELDATIDGLLAAVKNGDADGNLHLQLAQAHLRYALNRIANQKDPTFLLQDADRFAAKALELDAANSDAAALRARALHLLGRADAAGGLAAQALPALIADAGSSLAATMLEIIANASLARVYERLEGDADRPATAITDAHSAFIVLARHPAGTPAQVLAHARMLTFLGTQRACAVTLRAGVQRFPYSRELHEQLRVQALAIGGPQALLNAYDGIEVAADQAADIAWFDGYAALVAAEEWRRAGQPANAEAAYRRADQRLRTSAYARPDYADSANHFIVLAGAGRARLLLDAGDNAAVPSLLEAIALRPQSWESKDGLDDSPQAVARALRAKLVAAGNEELVGKLDAGLAALGLTLQ